jgi:hypothetical protein
MNEHAELLNSLITKDSLTSKEVLDGVVACFYATNRVFVQRRLGDVPEAEIDAALERLINKVIYEQRLDVNNPSISVISKVRSILDERSGFEAEPDLLEMHKTLIDKLFSLAKPHHLLK